MVRFTQWTTRTFAKETAACAANILQPLTTLRVRDDRRDEGNEGKKKKRAKCGGYASFCLWCEQNGKKSKLKNITIIKEYQGLQGRVHAYPSDPHHAYYCKEGLCKSRA